MARSPPRSSRSWPLITAPACERGVIAGRAGDCLGYCSWDVDHAGWVVTPHSPEVEIFYGRTLEEALAWRLVWLMAPEIGVGPFQV
jgi:hypothetical protein